MVRSRIDCLFPCLMSVHKVLAEPMTVSPLFSNKRIYSFFIGRSQHQL